MPRLFHLLLVSAFQFFSFSAFTAEASSLEQLQTSFMSRYDEANAERDQNLKKLEASYLGALQRHMDKVKASGKLERVIPVRDEIEAIETGADPLPALPKNADRDLGKMREKYTEARGRVLKTHAEALVGLSDTMDQALKKEEADLTRAGKIDEALAAKRMRETLANDVGITSARKLLGAAGDSGSSSIRLGAWRNLLDEEMTIVETGPHFAGRLDSIPADAKVLAPLVHVLKQRREKPETILMAHAPRKIEFGLKQPATMMKGKIFLGNPAGNATFRVYAGNKLRFESVVDSVGDKSFEVEFDPTRKLILEIDAGGDSNHDWTAWLEPEVR